MKIFISVVSHGHNNIIRELDSLSILSEKYTVIIKENSSDNGLKDYCENFRIHFLNNSHGIGFGENNNQIFNYCIKQLDMKDEDIFIILNPDVFIDLCEMEKVINKIKTENIKLLGINLYRDDKYTIYDNSIRKYPNMLTFICSFLGFKNKTIIDKSFIYEDVFVDWFSGSFMAFNVRHYKNVGGFDIKYFMYCEDIDICFRSKAIGVNPIYIPSIKAIHKAQFKNREILSKHFFWHVKSAIRFLLKKQLF